MSNVKLRCEKQDDFDVWTVEKDGNELATLTVNEAAQLLSVNPNTVRVLINSDNCPFQVNKLYTSGLKAPDSKRRALIRIPVPSFINWMLELDNGPDVLPFEGREE